MGKNCSPWKQRSFLIELFSFLILLIIIFGNIFGAIDISSPINKNIVYICLLVLFGDVARKVLFNKNDNTQ